VHKDSILYAESIHEPCLVPESCLLSICGLVLFFHEFPTNLHQRFPQQVLTPPISIFLRIRFPKPDTPNSIHRTRLNQLSRPRLQQHLPQLLILLKLFPICSQDDLVLIRVPGLLVEVVHLAAQGFHGLGVGGGEEDFGCYGVVVEEQSFMVHHVGFAVLEGYWVGRGWDGERGCEPLA